MDNQELIDVLEQFKSGVTAVSTDGQFSEQEYKRLRGMIINSPVLKPILPSEIKYSMTPADFRSRMQEYSSHYKNRRAYIADVINKLIFVLEETNTDSFSNIEEYAELERIGDGGYGEVFLYHHEKLDLDFAIKFFSPVFANSDEQEESEKRFFREAKILFSLHNDNIVQIYDASYFNGKPYIRMEYINGFDLCKLIKKYSIIPFEKSLIVIADILKGLGYAHNKGIVHRDLKPSNVMFSKNEKCFKIIDFGVSAFLDTEIHTKLTKTGENVAGGLYIDPILQRNPRIRDKRTDIYSIGAIWYFLLTGQDPSGSDMRERLKSIADLDDETIELIMKCMAYELENRYESCEELMDTIKPLL